MNRNFRKAPNEPSSSPPSEAELFALAVRGQPIPRIVNPEVEAKAKRQELERLAQFSSRHADELRTLRFAEAEARHERELLEWAAQISTEAAAELRALQRKEAEVREGWRRAEKFVETLLEGNWDSSKHPRAPQGQPDGGQWVAKGGGGAGEGSVAANAPGGREAKRQMTASGKASDPSHWYLPSEDKGTWLGEKGKSTFRLKTPVEVNGKLIHEIRYIDGVPVLDKFALPGKTATIILTGESDTDIRNAEAAWKKLNPGKEVPKNATFHHDLLHATEETVTINGKKTKILVGKMHLVPTDVNRAVFHQGSASVAKKYYQGLGAEMSAIERLAKEEASLAAKGGNIVGNAAKKIVPGKIAKGIRSLVGRNVIRMIPLVGTGLAIVDFAENAEAHGIGGALVRATPLLGDLVSAADLGTDLAKQITDEANAAVDSHTAAMNAPVTEAGKKASEQTIDAFQELAPQIPVTNEYGPNGLVDPDEVATALTIFRGRMQQANLLKSENASGFNFDAAAADPKRDLKERLTKAAQKDAPPPAGSLF